MVLVINGERATFPEDATLKQVVERSVRPGAAYAVEVNKTLVPRREHDARTLVEGDVIEIVVLVGGG
ncbi:MAG TPA: sulfur carrier protein ThiS [Phycisphaerales bacterium]|nr:sulfur carrier protein ThiS [Phycisphaerales bacterium]